MGVVSLEGVSYLATWPDFQWVLVFGLKNVEANVFYILI